MILAICWPVLFKKLMFSCLVDFCGNSRYGHCNDSFIKESTSSDTYSNDASMVELASPLMAGLSCSSLNGSAIIDKYRVSSDYKSIFITVLILQLATTSIWQHPCNPMIPSRRNLYYLPSLFL